jgi:hypothetical protein
MARSMDRLIERRLYKQRRLPSEERRLDLWQHAITGPEGSVPEPMQRIGRRRERVAAEEAAYLRRGRRAEGTLTARESGARGLSIRHFEELAKGAKDIEDYRKRKARI